MKTCDYIRIDTHLFAMLISDRRDDSPNVFSSSVELSYMGVVGDMTGVIGLRSSSFSSSGSTGGWASAKCKKIDVKF